MCSKIPIKAYNTVVQCLADRQLNTEFRNQNSRRARRWYNRHQRFKNNAVAHIRGQHLENLHEEARDICELVNPPYTREISRDNYFFKKL
jgi:hypothetical protein